MGLRQKVYAAIFFQYGLRHAQSWMYEVFWNLSSKDIILFEDSSNTLSCLDSQPTLFENSSDALPRLDGQPVLLLRMHYRASDWTTLARMRS